MTPVDLDPLAERQCQMRVLRVGPTLGGFQAVVELLRPPEIFVALAATPNAALAEVLAKLNAAHAPAAGGVFD